VIRMPISNHREGKIVVTLDRRTMLNRTGAGRIMTPDSRIFNEVHFFRQLEENLPPAERTGIPLNSIRTEAQAVEYLRAIRAVLRSKAVRR
jgi:hypothetical protein